jgi:hypothetical protein
MNADHVSRLIHFVIEGYTGFPYGTAKIDLTRLVVSLSSFVVQESPYSDVNVFVFTVFRLGRNQPTLGCKVHV